MTSITVGQAVADAVTMLSTLPYAPSGKALEAAAILWKNELKGDEYTPDQILRAARRLVREADAWPPLAAMLRACATEAALDFNERMKHLVPVETAGGLVMCQPGRESEVLDRMGAPALPEPMSDERRLEIEERLRELGGPVAELIEEVKP